MRDFGLALFPQISDEHRAGIVWLQDFDGTFLVKERTGERVLGWAKKPSGGDA